ncbi:uncharacterized protein LOC134188474 [Corticium candelabrum]|uniref:uncharacterized protein LOC134188474 n=1 Tax=Corticium candelabrum TaxID=121492 RepID=UPI002E266CFE|nr:uncharacterized protein LOC134188474 [Corticium candelabrum]
MSNSEENLRERLSKLRKRIDDGELDRETVRERLQQLLPGTPTRSIKCYGSCLLLVILLMSFGTLMYYNKATRQFMKRNLAAYSYPVLRRIRLLLVPFIRDGRMQWESVYEADCMIDNPYFDAQGEWHGDNGKKLDELKLMSIRGVTEVDDLFIEEIRDLLLNGHPVVIRGVSGVVHVTYSNMRDFINSNWENVSIEICEFQRGNRIGKSDVFVSEIFSSEEDPCGSGDDVEQQWSVSWKHCSQDVIGGFIRLPEMLLSMGEFSKRNQIYCGCPFSEHDFVEESSDGEQLVLQLTGAKRFIIHSYGSMKSFGVTLKAGDILIYGKQYWNHQGLPQGEGICMSYSTSFELSHTSQS